MVITKTNSEFVVADILHARCKKPQKTPWAWAAQTDSWMWLVVSRTQYGLKVESFNTTELARHACIKYVMRALSAQNPKNYQIDRSMAVSDVSAVFRSLSGKQSVLKVAGACKRGRNRFNFAVAFDADETVMRSEKC